MVRCYANGHTGTTAFFRNRPWLTELTALLGQVETRPVRVLFQACSIGAEPYSLALWWRHHVPPVAGALRIDATDVEPEFLAVARRAVYPAEALSGLTAEERSWFVAHAEGVQVGDAARAMVRVLPPQSFLDPGPDRAYDAVCIMNALTYVSPLEQRLAIAGAARMARHVVALTAFHPDTIAADIAAAGLVPWPGQQRAIHEAWGDRLVDTPVTPGSPYYSFQLPRRYPEAPDGACRYGALFVHPVDQAR